MVRRCSWVKASDYEKTLYKDELPQRGQPASCESINGTVRTNGPISAMAAKVEGTPGLHEGSHARRGSYLAHKLDLFCIELRNEGFDEHADLVGLSADRIRELEKLINRT